MPKPKRRTTLDAGKSEGVEGGKVGGGVHQSRDSISIMSKCIA